MNGRTRTLLEEGRSCWRCAAADRLAFLVDGEDYFAAVATAILSARRCVRIAGWMLSLDVDLLRDDVPREHPISLGGLLRWRLQRVPELEVHLLVWDFPLGYRSQGYETPRAQLHRYEHPRLHLAMDGEHPPVASHHQKIVIVDGTLAFVGGNDLCENRWDTRAHRPGDQRRTTTHGSRFGAWHDVQMLVDGEAAVAIDELFVERWQRATGAFLPRRVAEAPWPQGVPVAARGIRTGIARTEPLWHGRRRIREIEAWYLRAIEAARRRIYIENQYFTSKRLIRRLARKLRDAGGPEVAIVLPSAASGFMERYTMDLVRARLLRRLRRADRYGRLLIAHPWCGDDRDPVLVHAKLCIVDDRFCTVGSANISNRSFGLDTELNLHLEEDGSGFVAAFRHGLLGEHLGLDADAYRRLEDERGSMIAAIRAGVGTDRGLTDISSTLPRWVEILVPAAEVVDPGTDFDPDSVHQAMLPELPLRRLWDPLLSGAILVVLLLVGIVALFSSGERALLEASLATLREPLMASQGLLGIAFSAAVVMLRLPAAVGAFALGLGMGFWPSVGAALVGSSFGAAAMYGLARVLPRRLLRFVARARLRSLALQLSRLPPWTVTFALWLVLGSLPVIALAAGAARMRLQHFLAGVVMGMLPSCVFHTLAGALVAWLIVEPSPWLFLGIAAAMVAWLGLCLWLRYRLQFRPRARDGTQRWLAI